MSFGWVLLGFIGIVVLFAFLHVVTRMETERESLARRTRMGTSSLAGDTITYAGTAEDGGGAVRRFAAG